ncbi:hypothetical protein F4802DRAFT_310268 [Xylaria palmicola]|nr:hypothetical protein F4802DRAFT_310268 [Xylaria palmicola]
MRTVSLPRETPTRRRSRAPRSDVPAPLHIIKRTKTVEFRPNTKRDTSNGSMDCGPDRPLSVVKKRQGRPLADEVAPGVNIPRIGNSVATADRIPPAQRHFQPEARQWGFSGQRTSSSGTTRRRYSTQSRDTSDGSSAGQPPSLGFLDNISVIEPFESHSPVQMDTSFSSMPISVDCNDDCHLLVPRLSVTAEVQTSNHAISTVWAAIEISVQLARPFTYSLPNQNPNDGFLSPNPLRVGSVSRFGYLYNVQVDVFPVPGTAVIEVIQNNKERNLGLGSSMLVLAKVRIDHQGLRQPDRAIAQKSNKLIADLESELGVASIKYLQVRVRYCHSGFPKSSSVTPTGGTTDYQTQLETTATCVIDQQALNSPSCASPARSCLGSLAGIVASYWGPFRANEILSQETCHQSSSAVAADLTSADNRRSTAAQDGPDYRKKTDTSAYTPFPRRRVGLQAPSPEQGEDPARKIWTEMRRRISGSRPKMRASNTVSPDATTPLMNPERPSSFTGSLRIKSDVDRRRELLRDVALRNKRSIGAESLKSLVPSMRNLEMSSREAWGDSSSSLSNAHNKENFPTERRKEGRWSLGAWW